MSQQDVERKDSVKKAQPPIVDSILQYGKLAFDPELPEQSRKPQLSHFLSLLERSVIIAYCWLTY